MQKIIKNAELHESMESSKFNPIQDQDLVLIFYDKRRRWIRKVEKAKNSIVIGAILNMMILSKKLNSVQL